MSESQPKPETIENENENEKEKKKRKKRGHSGYVALIGRTNVGKSTFLNTIMETKISIVSDKPQTTRKQILGIKTTKKGQIIFFDTPGIHKPYFRLNEKMMKDVHSSLNDADLILFFIDITEHRKDDFIISSLNTASKPVFLVINKIDKFSKSKALEIIDRWKDVFSWSEIIPISALKEINIDLLEELIYKYLPLNDPFFPEEELTLQSQKYYTGELIREKILHMAEEELPFTTTVQIEEIADRGNVMYIRADIYVETVSQKKILVGKQGNFVKLVGQMARKDLEEYYEKQVYVDLFIKVVPNWRNSEIIISQLEQ